MSRQHGRPRTPPGSPPSRISGRNLTTRYLGSYKDTHKHTYSDKRGKTEDHRAIPKSYQKESKHFMMEQSDSYRDQEISSRKPALEHTLFSAAVTGVSLAKKYIDQWNGSARYGDKKHWDGSRYKDEKKCTDNTYDESFSTKYSTSKFNAQAANCETSSTRVPSSANHYFKESTVCSPHKSNFAVGEKHSCQDISKIEKYTNELGTKEGSFRKESRHSNRTSWVDSGGRYDGRHSPSIPHKEARFTSTRRYAPLLSSPLDQFPSRKFLPPISSKERVGYNHNHSISPRHHSPLKFGSGRSPSPEGAVYRRYSSPSPQVGRNLFVSSMSRMSPPFRDHYVPHLGKMPQSAPSKGRGLFQSNRMHSQDTGHYEHPFGSGGVYSAAHAGGKWKGNNGSSARGRASIRRAIASPPPKVRSSPHRNQTSFKRDRTSSLAHLRSSYSPVDQAKFLASSLPYSQLGKSGFVDTSRFSSHRSLSPVHVPYCRDLDKSSSRYPSSGNSREFSNRGRKSHSRERKNRLQYKSPSLTNAAEPFLDSDDEFPLRKSDPDPVKSAIKTSDKKGNRHSSKLECQRDIFKMTGHNMVGGIRSNKSDLFNDKLSMRQSARPDWDPVQNMKKNAENKNSSSSSSNKIHQSSGSHKSKGLDAKEFGSKRLDTESHGSSDKSKMTHVKLAKRKKEHSFDSSEGRDLKFKRSFPKSGQCNSINLPESTSNKRRHSESQEKGNRVGRYPVSSERELFGQKSREQVRSEYNSPRHKIRRFSPSPLRDLVFSDVGSMNYSLSPVHGADSISRVGRRKESERFQQGRQETYTIGKERRDKFLSPSFKVTDSHNQFYNSGVGKSHAGETTPFGSGTWVKNMQSLLSLSPRVSPANRSMADRISNFRHGKGLLPTPPSKLMLTKTHKPVIRRPNDLRLWIESRKSAAAGCGMRSRIADRLCVAKRNLNVSRNSNNEVRIDGGSRDPPLERKSSATMSRRTGSQGAAIVKKYRQMAQSRQSKLTSYESGRYRQEVTRRRDDSANKESKVIVPERKLTIALESALLLALPSKDSEGVVTPRKRALVSSKSRNGKSF